MIKYYLLLTYLMISLISYSQDFELIESYYSPISVRSYSIGDTIIIGRPNYKRERDVSYSNILKYQERNWNQYSKVNQDLSKKNAIIKKIYSNKENNVSEFSNSVVLEVIVQDGSIVFIPIDKALISKEIVVFPNSTERFNNIPFNEKNAMILKIKAEKLKNEAAMIEYVKGVEPEKYNEWKENEFIYEKEKDRNIYRIDSLLKTVNVLDTMIIVLPTELGGYLFKNESFPIIGNILKYSKTLRFSNEYLTFVNFADFSSVNSSKERAEFFVNTNSKTYDGTRQAVVILKAKLESVLFKIESGGFNVDSSTNKIFDFKFKIIELVCVDNFELYYNYIGNKKQLNKL